MIDDIEGDSSTFPDILGIHKFLKDHDTALRVSYFLT